MILILPFDLCWHYSAVIFEYLINLWRKSLELVKLRHELVCARAGSFNDFAGDIDPIAEAKSDRAELVLLCNGKLRMVGVRRRVVSGRAV